MSNSKAMANLKAAMLSAQTLGELHALIEDYSYMEFMQIYEQLTPEQQAKLNAIDEVDSIWEIFAPLLHGLRTAIVSDETVKDPHRLVQTLSQEQVTRLVLVPSLLRVLLDTFPDLQSRLPKHTAVSAVCKHS